MFLSPPVGIPVIIFVIYKRKKKQKERLAEYERKAALIDGGSVAVRRVRVHGTCVFIPRKNANASFRVFLGTGEDGKRMTISNYFFSANSWQVGSEYFRLRTEDRDELLSGNKYSLDPELSALATEEPDLNGDLYPITLDQLKAMIPASRFDDLASGELTLLETTLKDKSEYHDRDTTSDFYVLNFEAPDARRGVRRFDVSSSAYDAFKDGDRALVFLKKDGKIASVLRYDGILADDVRALISSDLPAEKKDVFTNQIN